MGWRFQKRVRLFPGLRVNFSKSGISTSIGRRGAWFTMGPRGTRATLGLPGSGISYTAFSPSTRGHARVPYAAPALEPASQLPIGNPDAATGNRIMWIAILVALAVLAVWLSAR